MARLSPYSLSACKLKTTNATGSMDLSGVWIQGANRDVVLTVSHFVKAKPSENHSGIQATTAEVFTSAFGNLSSARKGIKCELFCDFDNPGGDKDFAVFVPCDGERSRSPGRAVLSETILPDATSLSGTVISFGYNGTPAAAVPNHPDPQIKAGSCSCENCWIGSGNTVRAKFGPNLETPDPSILAPGLRVMAVGEWTPSTISRQPFHTATGWYGISGSGMYAKDKQDRLRLVAIFQAGVFEGPDTDKNRAVVIPNDVLECLRKAGGQEV
ncbi:MAG: hypothetical protein M1822_008167 [Bathelium mastoideum]|nr:MAG: hypothetical protein M1822_008167 [Bathelium mastoideum]